ncbi:MAG: flagellar biosynthesis protein FliQ [Rhodothermales bacterium]
MNSDVALFWIQEALKTAALLTAPLLGVALVVGLIISLLQALTSIQEMTLSYVPKMAAVAVILLIMAPWMMEILSDFTISVLNFIPSISH